MPSQVPNVYRNPAATNTKILVIGGNQAVIGWNLINDNADSAYLKIYSAADIADVILGSTTPVETLLIPPGPGTALISNEDKFNIACPLGIVIAVTKSMADSASDAPTAVCYVKLLYANNT